MLPAAAVSWTPSADATVWTFHLRAGATFSNGAPVTAQDFKSAWERLLTGPSKDWGSFLLSNVKGSSALAAGKAKHLNGVVAHDATTLVVTLTAPFADFPSVVAHPSLGPVPHGLLSTAKKAVRFRNAPVGNGPFMLAEPWNRKGTIRLVVSPGYYGAKPHIAGITFTVVTDPAAAYAQFKAGAFDVCAFPATSLAEAEAAYGTSTDGFTSEPGHQVVSGPIAGVLWTVFNTKKAPLDDVRVRRAFSLAFDRMKLMAALPAPYPYVCVTPATDVLSPGVAGYEPGRWLYAKLDQAQAAALLAEAGYPRWRRPAGDHLPDHRPDHQGRVQDRPRGHRREGEVRRGETGSVLGEVDERQVHDVPGRVELLPDRCGAPSPTCFDGALDGSASFYDDPAVNASLRQACATLDDAARLAAFESIDATLAAAAPVAPVGYFSRTVVCSARLHDAVLSPMDLFDFTRVSIE